MAYEILPHTAEIGVLASGATAAEAISEAVRGLAAILCDADPPPPDGSEPLEAEAPDQAALLAAVLEEALFLLDARGRLSVGFDGVVENARASGRMLTAPASAVVTDVKAVTYHELSLAEQDGHWRARVYFDV